MGKGTGRGAGRGAGRGQGRGRGPMSWAAKKVAGNVIGGGSSSSSSSGPGIMSRIKDGKDDGSGSGGGGGKSDNGDDDDNSKLNGINCCICVGFVVILVCLIVAFAVPAWLAGKADSGSASSVENEFKVGLNNFVLTTSSTGGSTGSTKTYSFSDPLCKASKACKGWSSAGSTARVILIMFVLCLIPAMILACLFCAGEDILESCGDCLPCGMPGFDVPDIFPCATTAAAAGPRYLLLFPSACCDFMMLIIALMAGLIYMAQTSDDKKLADDATKELSLSTSFYMTIVMALFSCCLGGCHGFLMFAFPALVALEMADETGDSAGGIMSGIDVPGI